VDINVGELFTSFLVCSIGLVAFVYGKRQARVPQMVAGLILMIFPYFVSNVLLILGIGGAVVALMWGAIRYGW
jgi:hypothetical protein